MRLKNYVFFRETDKGVWFDAGRRSFALNGQGIYPLVERLVGALERSGRSPEALVTGLPAQLQAFARRLFDELARHQMLQVETLHAEEAFAHGHSAHAEFLKYLEDNIGDGSLHATLARWRQASIVVVGDGYAAKAAAGVLADSSVGRVVLHCTSTAEVDVDELQGALRDRGTSEISLREGEFDPAFIAAGVQGLIIAGSDGLALDRAIAHTRAALAAGIPVCVSLPIQGHLAVVSMTTPGVAGLADLADWLLPATEAITPSPANLAISGSLAAQDMIACVCGIGGAEHARARIVSPYAEVSVCPIPPSPARHGEDAVVRPPDMGARVEMPEARDLSPYEHLRMALAPWADPALSVLSVELPQPLPQLPLYHEAFAVRRPGEGRGRTQIAVGWGLSPEEAGLRASMNAIVLLAEQEFGTAQALAAGLDEEAWRSAALARAFVRHARFARDAVWGTFGSDEVEDAEAGVALRILQFLVPSPLAFKVGFVPGIAAFVVSCHAGGTCLSRVCLPSLAEAIAEAIGLAISRIQLRTVEGVVRPDHLDLADSPRPTALVGRASIEQASASAPATVTARFVRSRRLGLPARVACGYAVMEAAA